MSVAKRSILDKYNAYLEHKYPDWSVEIVHRTSMGKAGVWGVIELSRGSRSILLRVLPSRGVDRVRKTEGGRYMRVKKLLTKKQLQYKFGYAPIPRELLPEKAVLPVDKGRGSEANRESQDETATAS